MMITVRRRPGQMRVPTMPRLRFTIGRLMGVPLVVGGFLRLFEWMGSSPTVALATAVLASVGPSLLLLTARDRQELVAAYAAVLITSAGLVLMAGVAPEVLVPGASHIIGVLLLLFGYWIFHHLNRRPLEPPGDAPGIPSLTAQSSTDSDPSS
jgi:hypothetical protein